MFYDPRIGAAITLSGQYIIKKVGLTCDQRFNEFFKTKDVKYNVYSDTDSCRGDSLVYVNNDKIPIAELYDMFSDFTYSDEFNRNYVKLVNDATTKSFNIETQKIEDKKINYVMKHRVKKEMFEITTESGLSVIVTEDHSVIVKRDGNYISVCPRNIDMENDIIINIDINNTHQHNAITK